MLNTLCLPTTTPPVKQTSTSGTPLSLLKLADRRSIYLQNS